MEDLHFITCLLQSLMLLFCYYHSTAVTAVTVLPPRVYRKPVYSLYKGGAKPYFSIKNINPKKQSCFGYADVKPLKGPIL